MKISAESARHLGQLQARLENLVTRINGMTFEGLADLLAREKATRAEFARVVASLGLPQNTAVRVIVDTDDADHPLGTVVDQETGAPYVASALVAAPGEAGEAGAPASLEAGINGHAEGGGATVEGVAAPDAPPADPKVSA